MPLGKTQIDGDQIVAGGIADLEIASNAAIQISKISINSDVLPFANNTQSLGSAVDTFENLYLKTGLILQQTGVGTNGITLKSPTSVTSYSLTLPAAQGASNNTLFNDGSGNLSWNSVLTNPLASTLTISPTTNQLILGTTYTTTISSTAPSVSRTYTIPDAGAASNFVLDQGNYTIAGAWSFTKPVTITNALVSGTPASASQINTGDPNTKGLIIKGNAYVYNPTPKTPDQVTGLIGWWKADAITGLTDGQSVNSWNDSSGAGLTLAKVTNSPVYKTGILNGLPVVRLANNNDEMKTANITQAQPFTVFMVYQATASGSNIVLNQAIGGSSSNSLVINTGTNIHRISAGTQLLESVSSGLAWQIDALVFNSTTSLLRVNGTQTAFGNAGTNYYNNAAFSISAANPNGLTGDIAEIIVYGTGVSTADIQSLEAYLAIKYNIIIASSVPQVSDLLELQSSTSSILSGFDAHGRLMLATSAGTPLDIPPVGTTAYDTTSHQLDIYDGGWKSIIENALPLTGGTLTGALTITPVTNQLVLGTTNTTTISSIAPSASRIYTIPDAGTTANMVLDHGNYTIAGTWGFSNNITLASSKALVLTDNTTNTVSLEASNGTTSYALSFPITAGTVGSFLQTDGSGNLSWQPSTNVFQYVNYIVGTPSGTYSGSTTVFALPFSYVQNGKSLEVYYNGQQLIPVNDYAETSSTSITTTVSLVAGTEIAFRTISSGAISAAVALYREDYIVGTALNNYTGSSTVFNLVNSYTVGGHAMLVTLDGDIQTIGSTVDYLETNSTTVTFNNALVTGEKVSFIWSQTTATGGTVNSGTQYQLAYYAANGATLSGNSSILTNINNQLLVTDGTVSLPGYAFSSDINTGLYRVSTDDIALATNGVKQLEISTTAVTTFLPTAIKGTTTNDSTATGYVGEYIESLTGNTALPTSTHWGDLTSISLTAGDWDVTAVITYNATTVITNCVLGISTTAGNDSTGLLNGSNFVDIERPTSAADGSGSVPSYRISLAGTTTVYQKFQGTYTGSPTARGRLSARRMR